MMGSMQNQLLSKKAAQIHQSYVVKLHSYFSREGFFCFSADIRGLGFAQRWVQMPVFLGYFSSYRLSFPLASESESSAWRRYLSVTRLGKDRKHRWFAPKEEPTQFPVGTCIPWGHFLCPWSSILNPWRRRGILLACGHLWIVCSIYQQPLYFVFSPKS